MKVSADKLNVKELPNNSSKTIGNVYKGYFVISERVIEDGWMPIKYGDKDGFIRIEGLDFYTHFSYKIAKDKEGVVVKEKPDSSSKVLITLKKGIVVQDYGEIKNGYSYISYGNYIGFTETSNLIKPKPVIKYADNSQKYIKFYETADLKEFSGLMATGGKVLVYSSVNGMSFIDEYPDNDQIEGFYVESKYIVGKKPITKKIELKENNSSSSSESKKSLSSGYYKNCTELRKDFPYGVREGHWAYATKHDRDKDGWACER